MADRAGQDPFAFTITEQAVADPETGEQILQITLAPPPPTGIGQPIVAIDGYDTMIAATQGGCQYRFRSPGSDGRYLTAVDGQKIAARTVVLPDLNVLAAPYARASCAVTRNAQLVPDKETAEYRVPGSPALGDVGAQPVPVYLLPPTTFTPAEVSGQLPTLGEDKLIELLSGGIGSWFKKHQPRTGGDLCMTMTIFAGAARQTLVPMPLVVFDKLLLHAKDWTES